jgi:hypothetical protein
MPANTPSKSKSASAKNAPADAIELLKADHREAEAMFAKFESARTGPSKRKIAEEVCQALIVHTRIEEEIFYPACQEAGVEEDLLKEAKVEHDGAKQLIEEILAGSPADDLYEAKVKVLSEQIEHHVGEEEGRDGIFAQAKKKKVDLDALGEKMAARKAQLEKTPAKR